MARCTTDLKVHQGGGTSTRQNLLEENARLRLVCDRAEAVIARHALLLREGDHRIKNSLQIVASLMRMQASREDSPTAEAALKAAASRIQSIARIHDALQESAGKDVVDLGEVLGIMCDSLHAMAGDPLSVSVLVEVEPIQAPIELAQPIVLAVNELVVNALRHAFPPGRAGIVRVNVVSSGGELLVTVTDDGQGLPPNHADGQGYGMKLVRMITKQIGATMDVKTDFTGTRYRLTVPAPEFARLVGA
jgi:two-component sensor histidine kinase